MPFEFSGLFSPSEPHSSEHFHSLNLVMAKIIIMLLQHNIGNNYFSPTA